ncbi:MAG: PQQ-binding-like beta-propeller repeat protein [Pirellulales bacterium]|nr:PQQ-binding-like beta-propeller repeat protein [Pirellulales bacterium]
MNYFVRFVAWFVCLFGTMAGTRAAEDVDILAETGIRGGFIVHIGCGNGHLTSQLCPNGSYVVHGLDADPANIQLARQYIRSLGLYGRVSVEQWAGGRLPYTDQLVNLVIAEQFDQVPMSEIMRVLAPRGVACILQDGKWTKTVKPWPDTIDEWTHFLHDASGNAVANDSIVGPPRCLRWIAPPLWLRSHETPSGIQSQIAAGGRLFYIFDEGLIGIVDKRFPERWSIICRDAFNGKELWRRSLPHWGWQEWGRRKVEGNDLTEMRGLRLLVPVENQRRLVADRDRLYVTMGYNAPLSILDAATGETITTVQETAPTTEILLSEGIVVAHVPSFPMPAGTGFKRNPAEPQSDLVALDAASGCVLWRKKTGGFIKNLFLVIDQGHIFYQAGKQLACRDLKTGAIRWETMPKIQKGCSLVAQQGVVLILGDVQIDSYDATTGELLWNKKIPKRSGAEVDDLFVVNDLVWPGMISVDEDLQPVGKSERAMAIGFDLRTGAIKKQIVVDNFRSPEHHHRCYRNKATCRYIISGMEGAEFMDLVGDNHSQNNWLRGSCRHGIMPCHGLLYVPPDQCFCQPGAKLLGYSAVAPASSPREAVPDNQRLHRGPHYGISAAVDSQISDDAWPTYRHDAARSGSTEASIAGDLAPAWEVSIDGRPTAPVIANGKLIVAGMDTHTIHALDAASGATLWQYTAGGRIDSPPTLFKGFVLFGSKDGWIYCLRDSDGGLVWRFLAAPMDQRIVAFDQIESVWPVHGSVLIRHGIAYFTAGRSTYLDGGITVYGLDPCTGEIRHRGHMEGPHPDLRRPRDVAFYVPGANSDVLVSEGDHIYMRQKKLTPQLEEVGTNVLSSKGEADIGLHVFSTSGLLDHSWYNRTFWMYSKRWPGFQLANQSPKSGQLLVTDATTTYAVKVFYRRNVHSPMFFPGKEGYLLFADRNTNEPQIVGESGARRPVPWLPQSDYSRAQGNEIRLLGSPAFGLDKMIGYTRAEPPLWSCWIPVRVQAMVKTSNLLFVAGPPDIFDPQDPFAAFEDRKGGRLIVISPQDGNIITEKELASPPIFDGLIAADGRLYMATCNGKILCFKERVETGS